MWAFANKDGGIECLSKQKNKKEKKPTKFELTLQNKEYFELN